MKRSSLAVVFICIGVIPDPILNAADTPPTIEQRLSIIERELEIHQKNSVVASAKEFQIKSSDDSFALKFTGVLQTDYRDFQDDRGASADQFLIRRARVIFDATFNRWIAFRLVPDFANGGGTTAGPTSSLLQDGYLELQPSTLAKFRFGKFKSPIGLDLLQSDPAGPFVERTLTTQLVPNRDTGIQISGDFAGGVLSYQTAIFNGVPDASSSETDANDGKDYVGRIFVQPFKKSSSELINGFGVGLGASTGRQFGSSSASGLTAGYRTDGQQTFFTYQTNTFASGNRNRIAPQAHWYTSHWGLLWEYIASSQQVQQVSASTATTALTHRAWQLYGSYVLTGERPSYSGIKPRQVFNPKNGGWGAVELAGRYAIFRAEPETFSGGFASLASSAQKAKAWAAGLNWYLTNNLRLSSDYAVTSFVGGAAAGNNRATEKVLLNRIQVTY